MATTSVLVLALISCWLSCSRYAAGKYVQGELTTREQWQFLTRFCFISGAGNFRYEVEYDVEYAVQRLLLYYDTPEQWDAVYQTSSNCAEKLLVLDDPVRHQFINLSSQLSTASGCEVRRRDDDERATLLCRGNRTFYSARARWWFIAVANCDSQRGLSLRRYQFLMTNGRADNVWMYQFSADETYMLRTDVCMLLVQLGVLVASVALAVQLRSRSLLHSTYKLFLTAAALQLLGLALSSAAYGQYARDGVGLPAAKLLGKAVRAASDMTFLLLLLLCAKGYTITRGRLRQASAVKLTVFLCLYVLVWGMLFLHEQLFFDPGKVIYLYESPAGHGLVIIKLVGWGMFIYSTAFTIKHYPEKWNFYLPFSIIYTMWFISAPLVILFSNYLIDNWVREKVVNGVELAITSIGHLFFLYLTRPTAANRNFPFHVRTSQISIMEQRVSGAAGNNNLDAFGSHPYAPPPRHQLRNTPTELFVIDNAQRTAAGAAKPYVKQDGSFPHQSGTIFA